MKPGKFLETEKAQLILEDAWRDSFAELGGESFKESITKGMAKAHLESARVGKKYIEQMLEMPGVSDETKKVYRGILRDLDKQAVREMLERAPVGSRKPLERALNRLESKQK